MSNTVGNKVESDDLTIKEVFEDFYIVPDYQREYVWDTSNVEQFLTDIHEALYNLEGKPLDQSEYFIGSIVVCPEGTNLFQLIDGQQRLTTSYLVLCAVRDAILKSNETPSDSLKTLISAKTPDPKTGRDVFKYKLELQYEESENVLVEIAKMSEIDKIPKSSKSVEHIINAYKTIESFLNEKFGNDSEKLFSFFASFIYKIKLIKITTPNLSHALKVFETINDRGIGLNSMDLLKNLIFMKTAREDYNKLKDKWKKLITKLDSSNEKPLRFLRYYIMSKHLEKWNDGFREDDIYEWFNSNQSAIQIDTNPLKFVDNLLKTVEDYTRFLNGIDRDGNENANLSNIRILSGATKQHLILLLASEKLSKDQFNELASQIEALLFCYIITRESTKVFERNFTLWAMKLREVESEDDFQGFIDSHFKKELHNKAKDFEYAMNELSQDRIQQYRIKYILAKLTQYIELQAWGNPMHNSLKQYVDKSVHIEHILPQTPTEDDLKLFATSEEYYENVGLLGNVTLLEKTINTSISNNSYSEKCQGYKESSFLLTKSLVNLPNVGQNTSLNRAVQGLKSFTDWDSNSIKERQYILTELAKEIWLIK